MEQQRTLIEVVGEDELIIHEDLAGEEAQELPGLEDLLYEESRDTGHNGTQSNDP